MNRGLLADIRRIHEQHGRRYGAPRIPAVLRAEGRSVSRGRIQRLMRRNDIRAATHRRFRMVTTDSNHGLPVADNLLAQSFFARVVAVPRRRPNLFTRKVVGWAMRDHLRQELTIAALTMAIQRQRPGRRLIHHSDRGSQYAADDYRALLKANMIIPSMSRKGNCWDNAPMEGWFHTLKTELVHNADARIMPRRKLTPWDCGTFRRGGSA